MVDIWIHQESISGYVSTSSFETYCQAAPWVADQSFTANRIGFYVWADSVNDVNFRLCIYDSSFNVLAEITIDGVADSVGWQDFDLDSDVSISNGNTYYFGNITDSAATAQWKYRLSSAPDGSSSYENNITYPTFPDPLTDGGPSSYRYGAHRFGYTQEEYGGMLFDGASSQYLASVSSFTPPAEATVCFWMYILEFTGEIQRIMGNETLWEIELNAADPALLYNDLNQGGSYLSTATFATKTWYHVACTADNSNDAQIFIDGLFDSTDGTATGSPGADTLRIGHRTGAPADEYFNGFIEDMRIYNRVLSANEIATIYGCKGLDGIVHGLLHRWLMNEGSMNIVASGAGAIKDLASGQLNMTPNNSPVFSGTRMKYRRFG